MALKKKNDIKTNIATREESIVSKSKLPLVFISHDTRDAEIAEAFSKLLSNVSAGVLKSFRSSDKKGTQGIEYGVEWFPEVMKKLDDASDIVCLLTQNSLDRPWILYEAGVAKGKLNTTVLGIAIGLPLNKANNGPFAQFQNCGDEEDSLTKLVLQLVRRIPNAEPEEEIIKEQVKQFKSKIILLLKKQPVQETKNDELKEDASIAKLFEEVKIMFQDLPSRIERGLDPELTMKRKRKFHPFMLGEIVHFGIKSEEPNIGFLIMISLYKDEFPWLFEIGLETYRGLKSAKTPTEKRKLAVTFERALDILGHPILREMYGKSEESYIHHKEFRHLMQRFIDRYIGNEKDI
jgi:hypothetical protein